MQSIANDLQRHGREFVANGELRSLTAIPHPTLNTSAALAAGQGTLLAHAGPKIPLKHLRTDITLENPIELTIGG